MNKILKKITKLSRLSRVVEDGLDVYNNLKGRNSGERVFECSFGGKVVKTFIKDGQLDNGNHQGACGMRKDNKRIYCCQRCYPSKKSMT